LPARQPSLWKAPFICEAHLQSANEKTDMVAGDSSDGQFRKLTLNSETEAK